VVGLLTSPFVVAPAARVDTMAVRFRPGGAYPFLGGPLTALTDRTISLDDVWGRPAAHRMWQELAAAGLPRRSGDAAKADPSRRSGDAAKADLSRVAVIA